MKAELIMAAVTIAGALVVKYLITKRNENTSQSPEIAPLKRSHHLTDVFAQAKHHTE
jgi:hypothetical protein